MCAVPPKRPTGLVNAAYHNGKTANVLHYDKRSGRYAVALDGSGERLKVRAACLIEDVTDELSVRGKPRPPTALSDCHVNSRGFTYASTRREYTVVLCYDLHTQPVSHQDERSEFSECAAEWAPHARRPGEEGYVHGTNYTHFEKLADSQHDIDEDLMRVMNQMCGDA